MCDANDYHRDIALRCKQMWKTFPARIHYQSGCWKSDLAPISCLRLAEIYLNYLQTLFHIYRLTGKHDGNCSADMVQTCSSIIETTLQSGGFRNRAVYHLHHSFRASTVSLSQLSLDRSAADLNEGLVLRITQCDYTYQRAKNCKENHEPSAVC